MRILVAIPAVSAKMAKRCRSLIQYPDILPFESEGARTLDVFSTQLAGLSPDKFFGINVPHWPLEERGHRGVAGPGLPADELFYPPDLKQKLWTQSRKYDKWRPYPAEPPLSKYNVDMARKYAGKRTRIFSKVANDMRWEMLFYVEHSPASLAHLCQDTAQELSDVICEKVIEVSASMPYAKLAIFSPYGPGRQSGFVVSNGIDSKKLCNWEGIRKYLKGGFIDEDFGD